MKLQITHVQTFSLHDGPGVRTTLFLAGCPLCCPWCHNPEARSALPRLVFDKARCTRCGACLSCSRGVHSFSGEEHLVDRSRCTLCGVCMKACRQGALSPSIRSLALEEYKEITERQERVAGSHGGITFSGGEPLLQGETLLEFLDQTPLHKAMETCGYCRGDLFQKVLSKLDFVLFDLKLADETLHRRYTGVSREPILENLARLRESGKPFLLRTPLIPNITDTAENLAALEKLVGGDPWEKLPYNPLTPAKYERIGEPYLL